MLKFHHGLSLKHLSFLNKCAHTKISGGSCELSQLLSNVYFKAGLPRLSPDSASLHKARRSHCYDTEHDIKGEVLLESEHSTRAGLIQTSPNFCTLNLQKIRGNIGYNNCFNKVLVL